MKITAAERSSLIRLASSLPRGDEKRKTILAMMPRVEIQEGGQAAQIMPKVVALRNSIQGTPKGGLLSLGNPKVGNYANNPKSVVICFARTLAKPAMAYLNAEAAKFGLRAFVWDNNRAYPEVAFELA